LPFFVFTGKSNDPCPNRHDDTKFFFLEEVRRGLMNCRIGISLAARYAVG
jgi:hypothetical protein